MGHSRFLTFLKFRAKMSKFDGRWVMVGIQGFEEQMVLTKEKDHSIETQRRHDAVFNKKNKVIMDVKTMGTKRVFHRHFGTHYTNVMRFDLTKGTPDKVHGLLGEVWEVDIFEDEKGDMTGTGKDEDGQKIEIHFTRDGPAMVNTITITDKEGHPRPMVVTMIPAEAVAMEGKWHVSSVVGEEEYAAKFVELRGKELTTKEKSLISD